jgi:hypothetical protein
MAVARFGGRRIGAFDDAAAEAPAVGEPVDPADRIGRSMAHRLERIEERVEVADAAPAERHEARGHRHHPQGERDDDPGEAEPAHRRLEQPFSGCQPADLARRQHQLEPFDMAAEIAGLVLVLAMHVIGDGPAQGGEGRARRDRGKEAARQEDAPEIVEAGAGLGDQQAGRRIEIEQPVEPAGQDRPAAAVERSVAIAAPAGMDDDAFRPGGGERAGEVGEALRAGRQHVAAGDTAPAGKDAAAPARLGGGIAFREANHRSAGRR